MARNTLDGAYTIEIVGNYAYVASQDDGGVQVIDISSSTNPVGVGSIQDGENGADELAGAIGIAVQGEYAYVASLTDHGMQILSLPSLTTPTANIGNLLSNDIETDYLRVTQALTSNTLNINTNAMIGGSLTITGSASSSLLASNANAALTVLSGTVGIGTTSTSADLVVDGDVRLTGGLYDSTNSLGTSGQALVSSGSAVTWDTGIVNSVFTDGGDITYLTDSTDVFSVGTSTDVATSTGLAIYNRDLEILPGDPVGVGSVSQTELFDIWAIDVVGDYVYTAAYDFNDGVQVVDISDPTNPVWVGGILDDTNGATTLYHARDIVVRGNYAYVASEQEDGIQVLDISDPTNIVGVGSLVDTDPTADELDGANDIAIQGNYAYVAGRNDNGMQVVDITDPTNPVGVGSIDLSDPTIDVMTAPRGIAVRGNYAYVAVSSGAVECK